MSSLIKLRVSTDNCKIIYLILLLTCQLITDDQECKGELIP